MGCGDCRIFKGHAVSGKDRRRQTSRADGTDRYFFVQSVTSSEADESRIPAATTILDKCEYGVDNYNLNIVEVPECDEEEWEDD